MIKINVLINNNYWKKYILNPELYLKKQIRKLNKNNNFFKNKRIEFSLMLTENKKIRQLNKKFRNKNRSTDVLSFPFYEKKKLSKLLKNKEMFYLGDIIVNLNKIIINTKKKNFKIEFDKLWIHGLLHLLGSRHKFNKDYFKMKKLENIFLNSIN
jgi:probable rRNA maturation factor